MAQASSERERIVDCHTHLRDIAHAEHFIQIMEAAETTRMNILGTMRPEAGSGIPQALCIKALHPDKFYVFGGLNHATYLSQGKAQAPTLAEQVDILINLGTDGIKMIEGKPTSRRRLPIPFDSDYYADYFARVQERGFPILWHVIDPEEFWDPEKIPNWAKEHGWGYDQTDVQKETLYAEVETVLNRHPNLKIIFAHFYFLSADLPRAARFLQSHPNAYLDLAPGIEMYYNFAKDPEATRDFFQEHQDRIFYGTDIISDRTIEKASSRAQIVKRFLQTRDTFTTQPKTDPLLGDPEEGIIRGIALPHQVLAKIFYQNFEGLAGQHPRPLNMELAISECERIAAIANQMTGVAREETQAAIAAKMLREM
jgi:predicted TIM-barrel fold metal-dependent hydrolase